MFVVYSPRLIPSNETCIHGKTMKVIVGDQITMLRWRRSPYPLVQLYITNFSAAPIDMLDEGFLLQTTVPKMFVEIFIHGYLLIRTNHATSLPVFTHTQSTSRPSICTNVFVSL